MIGSSSCCTTLGSRITPGATSVVGGGLGSQVYVLMTSKFAFLARLDLDVDFCSHQHGRAGQKSNRGNGRGPREAP